METAVPPTAPVKVAPRPVRNYRALVFQGYVVAATLGFAVLFFLARTIAYFDFDVTIMRAVRSFDPLWFDYLMRFLSTIGYSPQVYILCAIAVSSLFLIGLRWESVMALFAAAGVLTLGAIAKLIVERPRPTGDVANVLNPIAGYSFPSGHTLLFTAFCGFLWFLIYTLAPHSWRRTLALYVFGGMVALIGVSRVYLGEHWPSDVLAAYLLGSVWLAVTIYVYRWGKPRFFATQPVAPEKPATPQ